MVQHDLNLADLAIQQQSADTKPIHPPRWTVGWGFTSRCDLSCAFCYSSKVRSDPGTGDDLPLESALAFLKRNRRYIESLNFGTGESTVSPVFAQVLSYCEQHVPHAAIALTTNGAMARRSVTRRDYILSQLDECDVSLDFAEAKMHDAWRGASGVWKSAIESVEELISAGVSTTIVMIGTKQTLTLRNLDGMLTLASHYGVPLRINLYVPTTGDFSFSPNMEELWSAIRYLHEESDSMASSDPLIGALMNMLFWGDEHRSCRILPDGKVTASTYLLSDPWVAENRLDTVDLSELDDTEAFISYRKPAIPDGCRDCPFVSDCRGGSPVRRWLWFKTLDKSRPFLPDSQRR
jgi:radical SAM protein with 4Fe4S-binding SPASM domain